MDITVIYRMENDFDAKISERRNVQEQLRAKCYRDQDDFDTLNFIDFSCALMARQIADNIIKCLNVVEVPIEEEFRMARTKKKMKDYLKAQNKFLMGGGPRVS